MIIFKTFVFVVFMIVCTRLSEFIYSYLNNKLKEIIRRSKHVKR